MKKEELLVDLSKSFAIHIIRICSQIRERHKELVIVNQLLRSGTSIGANINEANYGHSPADFIAKMHIAWKETEETEYWIKLLNMSEYIDEKMYNSLLEDCLELKRILISSINTAKSNQK